MEKEGDPDQGQETQNHAMYYAERIQVQDSAPLV